MSIHNEHPFLPAEQDRNPVRRLRGRLASPVAVLTTEHNGVRAGLTVSSVLVVDGDPGAVLAVIDPLSELHDVLADSGTAVLNLLSWSHRQLADAFGYIAPAPGGPFRLADWQPSEWGPVLTGAPAWAGCRVSSQDWRSVGWGQLVEFSIDQVVLGADEEPLVHQRGRYRRLSEA
jgi:flavin reductase (DIM6/NTAB) family NADH-FMN oxidoreductase RutF